MDEYMWVMAAIAIKILDKYGIKDSFISSLRDYIF